MHGLARGAGHGVQARQGAGGLSFWVLLPQIHRRESLLTGTWSALVAQHVEGTSGHSPDEKEILGP